MMKTGVAFPPRQTVTYLASKKHKHIKQSSCRAVILARGALSPVQVRSAHTVCHTQMALQEVDKVN